MIRNGFRRGKEPPTPKTQYDRPIGPAMHRSQYRPPEPKPEPKVKYGPSQHRTYYNPPTHPVNSHRAVEEGPEIRNTTFQYGREDMPHPRQPEYSQGQYSKNDLPNPQKTIGARTDSRYADVKSKFSNQGLVRRIKEYHEKRNAPATAQEVAQLELNAKREKHKSDLQFYKNSRRQQFGGPLIRGGSSRPSGGGGRSGSMGSGMGSGMGGFGFGGGGLLSGGSMGSGMGSGMGGFGSGIDSLLSNHNPPVKRPVGRPPKQEPKKFGAGLDSLFGSNW